MKDSLETDFSSPVTLFFIITLFALSLSSPRKVMSHIGTSASNPSFSKFTPFPTKYLLPSCTFFSVFLSPFPCVIVTVSPSGNPAFSPATGSTIFSSYLSGFFLMSSYSCRNLFLRSVISATSSNAWPMSSRFVTSSIVNTLSTALLNSSTLPAMRSATISLTIIFSAVSFGVSETIL